MNLQSIYLFLATFLAFFIKGITGFGNTLIMGPLFSFSVSNRLTTPVDLLFSLPTNLFMVSRERKSISPKVVVPLSLMLLVGIIPGTLLLKSGSDRLLKIFLGVMVVGLALEMIFKKSHKAKKINPVVLTIVGVLSGVMAGMFGISALLVSCINRTAENKNQFRANLCCVFLADNLFRLFLYLFTGLLNQEVLRTALLLAPAVALGMLFGIKVDKKMNDKTVQHIVVVLLIVSGVTLIVKQVFFR